jgi:hypothetical protein
LQASAGRTARHLNKGKNWIINQALDEYLRKLDREALIAEARRQSLLASPDAENGAVRRPGSGGDGAHRFGPKAVARDQLEFALIPFVNKITN